MAGYVIDASVLVEIFVGGPDRDLCMEFLDYAVEQKMTLHAPDTIYYEVAGALRRYEINNGYSSMGEDIADFSELDLQTVTARELLLSAVEISRTYVIGVYDAFYLALSKRLDVPIVTVDSRLVGAVAGKRFQVRHIRDYKA
jgi:predicted nucleic acid-binding protein